MGKHKYLWLYVTPDKYELPVYVCDTARELAEKRNVSVSTVKTAARTHKLKGYGNYIKVEVEEDMNEDMNEDIAFALGLIVARIAVKLDDESYKKIEKDLLHLQQLVKDISERSENYGSNDRG